MIKKLIILVIILANKLFSDDIFYNFPNNHGSLGVINIPSARFYDSPSGSFSGYRGFPDRKLTLTLYPYDWMEASLFYSSFKGRPYGVYSQDYKDKGMNIKLRLKEQGIFPALAYGFNDIGGTGFYSSEYFVSSYGYGNFDFHIGAGWGRLNNFNHFENPFIFLSDSFRSRDSVLGEGGVFNLQNYFSGSDISIFAGMNYVVGEKYVFKIEFDPTQTPGRVGYKDRKSDINFGVNYLSNKYIFGINFERGSNLSLNLAYRDNFFVSDYQYKKDKNTRKGEYYKNLIKTLNKNNVGVSRIEKNDKSLSLTLTQNYHDLKTVENIVKNSIQDNEILEEVVVSYKIAGLEVIRADKLKDSSLVYKNKYRGLNQEFSLNLRPFIASREDFLKVGLLLEHDAEYIFSENLFFSSNVKLSIIDNFDDLIYPPVDVYPAQVRSDIKKYLNNLGEKLSIGRAQVEYFKTLYKNNHILLSAGIYEDMFTGFGFEYLNYDHKSQFNWGYEAHKIYKRDYDFGFGLLGYENITHHLNIYYENRELIPFDLKLSYGEYLAGDIGATIELFRSFKNGVRIGLFSTFTNVSFEDYGEGSFDKGIFFSIPFGNNRNIKDFAWRPLTKDPGAKLIRKNDIYSLVNKYSTFR